MILESNRLAALFIKQNDKHVASSDGFGATRIRLPSISLVIELPVVSRENTTPRILQAAAEVWASAGCGSAWRRPSKASTRSQQRTSDCNQSPMELESQSSLCDWEAMSHIKSCHSTILAVIQCQQDSHGAVSPRIDFSSTHLLDLHWQWRPTVQAFCTSHAGTC